MQNETLIVETGSVIVAHEKVTNSDEGTRKTTVLF